MTKEDDRYVGREQSFWLGQQLRMLRLPQRQVAQAMGIDAASLNRALKGRRRLSSEEYEKAIAFMHANEAGFGSRLGRFLHAKGLQIDEIAGTTGIDRARLDELISRPEAEPTASEARTFERHFDIPLAVTMPRARSERQPVVPEPLEAKQDDDKIAVYAALQYQDDGWFSSLGSVVEHRQRPAPLVGVATAFAVYVGEPMLAPRYEPGEVLFAHGGRPISIGRWAILEHVNGKVAIGRVLAVTSNGLELQSNESLPVVSITRRDMRRTASIVGTWSE